MKHLLKKIAVTVTALPLAFGLMMGTAHAEKIRIALAETPSDELAAFFVALERAKANGLDYEWTAFSDEELAIQAILSGQMDIGVNLHSKLTHRDHLKMTHPGGSKAHRRAASI